MSEITDPRGDRLHETLSRKEYVDAILAKAGMATVTREEWSGDHMLCMVCGYVSLSGENLETHEIARGTARAAAVTEPAAWLRVCGAFATNCHDALGDYKQWPVVRQLALKKMLDPYHYDRVAVNLLRDREPEAITEDEVDKCVQRMGG